MSGTYLLEPNPELDLVLERIIDVPPHLVWKVWTEPEHLKPWFTPRPWTTPECEIDLRPGGIFRTVMRSPEGDEHVGTGCFLEVVPERRIVWTGALLPGFRPTPTPEMAFTAVISMEPHGTGTRYTATVYHRNAEERARHAAMGFHEGWGAALDQLVAYVKELQGGGA
ncbi:MAG TPA: SRPBCC family protein [Longimicrobiales bacterium]|nr:SRPBCC family protein [Longimicrobiales bacterium]